MTWPSEATRADDDLRRLDLRFLLPNLPTSVAFTSPTGVVAPELLAAAGLEAADVQSADLVVCGRREAPDAFLKDAPHVLVGEGVSPIPPPYSARWLLAVPDFETHALVADLGQRAPATYALTTWTGSTGRAAPLKRAAKRIALRVGRYPFGGGRPTLASRASGPPALLSRAGEEGLADADSGWFATFDPGFVWKRGALFLLPADETVPARVIKFARVADWSRPFDNEEIGLSALNDVGGAVAAHAPTLVGRFTVGPHHASVETAGIGTPLDVLVDGRPASEVEAAVEAVGRWIIELGAATVRRRDGPVGLANEDDLLLAVPVVQRRVVGAALESVRRAPTVLVHGDLNHTNVLVDGKGHFTVIDWEHAHPEGRPLRDLVCYAATVLTHLEGARTAADHDVAFPNLFLGRSRRSEQLFGWVRDLARRLDLLPDDVGPLVTAAWLEYAARLGDRRADETARGLAPATEVAVERGVVGRAARLWFATDGLGQGWAAWHR